MMLETVSPDGRAIGDGELRSALRAAFEALGERRRIVVVPPDITRRHSFAGRITELTVEHYRDRIADVLPALGTHTAMTGKELTLMFGRVPQELFRVHRWKDDVETLGRIPAEFVHERSEGRLSFDWPAQVNRLLLHGGHDLILSIGQVVPHEVVGMAGYTKTLFVGTGGREAINKSHYLGAVYGMERIMGRAETPVRDLLDYASRRFAARLPVVHVLTVVGWGTRGEPVLRGLFIGDDREAFRRAAQLSLEVNLTVLEEPLEKVVVYLDPATFKSTWIGNKAIYRSRMAIADGGELIVVAPGVQRFGEDPDIDRIIRAHGYFTTGEVLERVQKNRELAENLAAAAHLIHGSSEGRFTITYAPGGLDRSEVERANYRYLSLARALERYPPEELRDGFNELRGGERVYYIPNPAMGLWASRARFGGDKPSGFGVARRPGPEGPARP